LTIRNIHKRKNGLTARLELIQGKARGRLGRMHTINEEGYYATHSWDELDRMGTFLPVVPFTFIF